MERLSGNEHSKLNKGGEVKKGSRIICPITREIGYMGPTAIKGISQDTTKEEVPIETIDLDLDQAQKNTEEADRKDITNLPLFHQEDQ